MSNRLNSGKGVRRLLNKYDRTVWVLFVARLINSFGYSIVMPFLAIYLYSRLSIQLEIIGILYAISTGIGALFSFIGGNLTDRYGRKVVLTYSIGLRCISYFAIAGYIGFMQPSFLVIAVLVIAASAFGGLYRPTLDVLVADYVPEKDRVEVYGLQRMAGNLGFSLGPMIGGFTAAFVSYQMLFFITGICNLLTLIVVLVYIYEPKVKKRHEIFAFKDVTALSKDKTFSAHCTTSLVLFIMASQLIVTLSLFSSKVLGFSDFQIGILFTINGLMVVFFQYLVSYTISDLKLTTALVLGSIIYAIGYFSIWLAHSFILMAVSMVVITLGELIVMPAQVALVAMLAPVEKRGQYMGFFNLFSETGNSIGPVLGTTLLTYSMTTPILLWGIISIIGLSAAIGYAAVGGLMKNRTCIKDNPSLSSIPKTNH